MPSKPLSPTSTPSLPSPLLSLKLKRLQELKELQAEVQRRRAESLRRVDVFGTLGYVPTPKQQTFHDATEFDVLFGGSAGGGKTRALLMDDLRDCTLYTGLRIGAFRRTFGELKE